MAMYQDHTKLYNLTLDDKITIDERIVKSFSRCWSIPMGRRISEITMAGTEHAAWLSQFKPSTEDDEMSNEDIFASSSESEDEAYEPTDRVEWVAHHFAERFDWINDEYNSPAEPNVIETSNVNDLYRWACRMEILDLYVDEIDANDAIAKVQERENMVEDSIEIPNGQTTIDEDDETVTMDLEDLSNDYDPIRLPIMPPYNKIPLNLELLLLPKGSRLEDPYVLDGDGTSPDSPLVIDD